MPWLNYFETFPVRMSPTEFLDLDQHINKAETIEIINSWISANCMYTKYIISHVRYSLKWQVHLIQRIKECTAHNNYKHVQLVKY